MKSIAPVPQRLDCPLGQVINKTGTVDFNDPAKTAVTRYRAKLYDLSIIWDRLQAEVNAQEVFLEWLAGAATRQDKPSQEEVQVKGSLNSAQTRGLHLDIEDFLIHSRILMDQVALVVGYLLPGTVSNMNHPSFRRLRAFFQDPTNNPYAQDEEFARHMRDKTGWFDTLLRDYRDLLVVHNATLTPWA